MLKLGVKVSTSHGRSHHFGPYVATQTMQRDEERIYHWVRVNTGRPSKITGIFVDALTYELQQQIFDLGVTEEYEPGNGESFEAPCLTNVRHSFPVIDILKSAPRSAIMQSTASLDNISNLQVRRVGPRCMGLRILHGDGNIEILGQWDPADVTSISSIYDISEGPLAGLSFQATPIDKYDSYISNITPTVQNSPVAPRTPTVPFTQDFAYKGDGQVRNT